MKNIFKIILIYVVIFLLTPFYSAKVNALDPTKKLHHYVLQKRPTEYTTTTAITQTDDGYIWFGTEEGLLRYDGVKSKLFEKINTPAFISNNIIQLYKDSQSRLWIRAKYGLSIYEDNKFYRIQELDQYRLFDITEDNTGNIWLGSVGILIKYTNNKLTYYSQKENLPNIDIDSLYKHDSKGIWVGTYGEGFGTFQNDRYSKYTNIPDLLHSKIGLIHEAHSGKLWVGTVNQGVFIISKSGKYIILNVGHVLSIYEDINHNIWLGTYNNGLSRYSNNTSTTFTDKDGLPSNFIYAIKEDHENNLWVATARGLVTLSNPKFLTMTTKDGLSNNDITAVLGDQKGNIWIGTRSNGINMIDKNRNVSKFKEEKDSPNKGIRSLLLDKMSNLLIGTYDKGLIKYDGSFSLFNENKKLPDNTIQSIMKDHTNRLWIGTDKNGIATYDKGKFNYLLKENGLTSNKITYIFEDSNYDIWVGVDLEKNSDDGGLILISNEAFTVFDSQKGFFGRKVHIIYEDKDKNIWVGTAEDGLFLINNKKVVFNFTRKDGLFKDTAFSIIEDNNNNFWMSCNSGIYTINRKEMIEYSKGNISQLNYLNYGINDGMKTDECNGGIQPSGWRSNNGKMYFPTTEGLVLIDPDNIIKNKTPPPVYIEGMTVDGKNYSIKSDNKLKPGDNKIEFHFTALSFSDTEKVKFKYLLEGFDREWIESPGNMQTAYYTNLPPGNYKFKVTACNNDNLWNNDGAILNIIKLPHFYQTTWFFIGTIVFAICVFIVVHQIRVRQHNINEKELKLKVDTKTKELKEKGDNLQEALNKQKSLQNKLIAQARLAALGNLIAGFSHEISNPLYIASNGLSYISDKLDPLTNAINSNNKAEIDKYINNYKSVLEDTFSAHSRISVLIKNLHAYQYSREVQTEEYDIEKGISTTIKLLKRKLESNNIVVSTSIDNLPNIQCNIGELNQVITNLILNSCDAMPDGGKITIKGKKINNIIEITFEDNGPGIPQEIKNEIFDPFFTTKPPDKGTGLGLSISYEIIKNHNGNLEVLDNNKGTTFLITLPY